MRRVPLEAIQVLPHDRTMLLIQQRSILMPWMSRLRPKVRHGVSPHPQHKRLGNKKLSWQTRAHGDSIGRCRRGVRSMQPHALRRQLCPDGRRWTTSTSPRSSDPLAGGGIARGAWLRMDKRSEEEEIELSRIAQYEMEVDS